MLYAKVKVNWAKSPSPDVVSQNVVVKVDGVVTQEETVDANATSIVFTVVERSAVEVSVVPYDGYFYGAAAVLAFVLPDLEAPVSVTMGDWEIVDVLNEKGESVRKEEVPVEVSDEGPAVEVLENEGGVVQVDKQESPLFDKVEDSVTVTEDVVPLDEVVVAEEGVPAAETVVEVPIVEEVVVPVVESVPVEESPVAVDGILAVGNDVPVEVAPTVEEVPAVVIEAPKVEEIPVVEEVAAVVEVPAVAEVALVEKTPAVEEAAPVAESFPKDEAVPVVEATEVAKVEEESKKE